MDQDTLEWHEHRARHGNASEAAAVMCCGEFFPKDRRELARVKLGMDRVPETAPMRYGKENEAAVRELAAEQLGEHLEPAVMTYGVMSASLDGITPDGAMIVEIKVPYKGLKSSLWADVMDGRVPTQYWWQIQQQLMCAGAKEGWLVVAVLSRGGQWHTAWLRVYPDAMAQVSLKEAWQDFFARMHELAGDASESGMADMGGDPDWDDAARKYQEAKRLADHYAEEVKRHRARLIELADPLPEKTAGGTGVRVTRTEARGSIDYKAALRHYVPDLSDDDLEQFRKSGTVKYTVTIKEE